MKLSLEIISDHRWSFAYAGTRRQVINKITLHQNGDLPDQDIEVFPRVTLNFPLPEELAPVWEGSKRIIEAKGQRIGDSITWERIDLSLNYPLLGRLQEKVQGQIIIEIVDAISGQVLEVEKRSYELLAPNQWQFEESFHEVLSAFVIPNDQYVSKILKDARDLLEKRTGDSSTQGYQAESPYLPGTQTPFSEYSRAYKIAEAIYDAMAKQGYSYSNPQGNFDDDSQRVRTPSQIDTEDCATCLDSAVLMAACFAQAGLEPVLFLIRGHAFAGYFTGRAVTNSSGQIILDQNHNPVIGDRAISYWKGTLGSIVRRNSNYAEIQRLLLNNHIQPVETTTTTRGSAIPFHEACLSQNNFSVKPTAHANGRVSDDSTLESIILVSNAWKEGITPPVSLADVPLHIGNHLLNQQPDISSLSEDTDSFRDLDNLELSDVQISLEERAIPPRIRQWMASLLDLSARNPLLKMKPNQVMEFDLPAATLGLIDDLLYTPKKRVELASPAALPFDWVLNGAKESEFESWIKKQPRLVFPTYKELNGIQRSAENLLREIRKDPNDPIANFSKADERIIRQIRLDKSHRYHKLSDAQLLKELRENQLESLNSRLTKDVRKVQAKAKEVFLTTGNNSLYLALGSVTWSETTSVQGRGKETHWSAPLYLYPVILEGGKGSPYSIRLDPNGDATPNYCLHEKLKRAPYHLDLQELINPEHDAKGIDFDKMIRVIEQRLRQANLTNFAVQPRAAIGVFNYSTFRLWKDIKDNWQQMCATSPVVHHLAYTSNIDFQANNNSPSNQFEPHLPIPADDSQRQAVQWALDGQSFRLEGPPGTGKSQTITNLLASCIAANKKVLFIAEKQTALDAVKDRLEASGLGKYTLNLHAKGDSDTKLRKTITDALTTALNQRLDPEDSKWEDLSFRMKSEEEILNRYRDSLHSHGPNGWSAWKAHELELELGDGGLIGLPNGFVDNFATHLPELRSACAEVESSLELIGDPRRHIWNFVDSQNLSATEFALITPVLRELERSFSALQAAIESRPGLLQKFEIGSFDRYSKAFGYVQSGWLPSIAQLDTIQTSLISNKNLDSDNEGSGNVSDFFVEAHRLAFFLTEARTFVNPTVVGRADLREIQAQIEAINSEELTELIKQTKQSWTNLAQNVARLDKRAPFVFLSENKIAEISEALENYDSNDEFLEFQKVSDKLKKLEQKARQHLTNIDGSFLDRTDLLNIAVLIKDAEEAGAFSRKSKFRTLRETVGAHGLSKDDRLLVLSLKEFLMLAPESQELRSVLRTKYPFVYSNEFQPWNIDHIESLEINFQKNRVFNLRRTSELQNSLNDDERFLLALRSILEFNITAHELIKEVKKNFPEVNDIDYQPWVELQANQLQQNILDRRTANLRNILGTDALTKDNGDLIAGLTAWIMSSPTLESLDHQLRTSLLVGYQRPFSPWLTDDVEELENVFRHLLDLRSSLSDEELVVLSELGNNDNGQNFAELFASAGSSWHKFIEHFSLTTSQLSLWTEGRNIFRAVEEETPKLLADAGSNDRYNELSRWKYFENALSRIEALGFIEYPQKIKDCEIDISMFEIDVRRSVIKDSLRERLQAGNLDRFDRKIHERRITNYDAALQQMHSLLKMRIPGIVNRRHLQKQSPTGNNVGATNSLLQGLRPIRGEKTPIRDLILKYGPALADAIPCFLMSPDSVSTLIPVGAIKFDLVIFDEASQVRTANAIGALGRGSAGIVVGDSRQMPPSNTFSSNTGAHVIDDDFVDQEEADDFFDDFIEDSDEETEMIRPIAVQDDESILKDFASAKLPYMQLLCHYRSKDELLISFSNTHIYDEPMLTFPSTKGLESSALSYRYVDGGHFERDKTAANHTLPNKGGAFPSLRTNIREAEEIVQDVLTRLRDPRTKARRENDPGKKAGSIIIVTFNIQQRNLITELFRTTDNAVFEEATQELKVSSDSEETYPPQLKIRNLENVQGDEAEVVIFSVAFSAKPDGKFPLNWGPVTQAGGDRKLNVAVTRAQNEMIVYASFLPDEMIPKGKKAGAEAVLLQKFFQLAYRGPNSSGDVGVNVPSSRHIESIAKEIRQRGFQVQTQLGLSTLRVDIAVKNPESEDWQLAIMVDDSCWNERGSAFQREILPRQVLPALGWEKVLRIWLPSWLEEKEDILNDITEMLEGSHVEADVEMENLISSPRPIIKLGKQQNSAAAPPPSQLRYSPFTEFEHDVVEGIHGLDLAINGDEPWKLYITDLIERVLDVEAPIEEVRLAKTICRTLNFSRVPTERVQQVLSFISETQFTTDPIGRFVWKKTQDSKNWNHYRTSLSGAVRASDEISCLEYFNALDDMVKRLHSVSHNDAVREIAAVFGFKTLTSKTRIPIEIAIEKAVKDKLIALSDGEYREF
jgi:hypothetical protein